jgi:hypothetical protein
LFYNHYDVQPPEPLDLWHSAPFAPVLRDGALYARGAKDDHRSQSQMRARRLYLGGGASAGTAALAAGLQRA